MLIAATSGYALQAFNRQSRLADISDPSTLICLLPVANNCWTLAAVGDVGASLPHDWDTRLSESILRWGSNGGRRITSELGLDIKYVVGDGTLLTVFKGRF